MIFPNLKAEMARHDITARSLAEKSGIKYETLKNKMTGETEFRRSEMFAIKQVFPGCSLDYLFTTEKEASKWDMPS